MVYLHQRGNSHNQTRSVLQKAHRRSAGQVEAIVINQTKEVGAGTRAESDWSDIFKLDHPVLLTDLAWGFRERKGH